MKNKNINKLFFEKLLSYNLHFGSLQKDWEMTSKSYIQGIRNNFCILNLSETVFFLRHSLRFLRKLLSHDKKILFLGSPKGLEKEFGMLCLTNEHYLIENWSSGFFTNLKRFSSSPEISSLKIKKRPSLIFIFDLSRFQEAKSEALRLEIPIMAFVNTDESLENIDYPIPANVKSWKGGLFVYNLLFHMLSLSKKIKT